MRDIIAQLKQTYCRIDWHGDTLRHQRDGAEALDSATPRPAALDHAMRRALRERWNVLCGYALENTCARQYVSPKRFSLEGGEHSFRLAVNSSCRRCRRRQELVIGMAHRGRA
ncbi:MAG: hypothetical protein U1F34_03220 [Gammaproteobacteria bacterium]